MRFRHQQGAVLIISLMILLIMTLIGVTAMNTTTLEEKMAGNMRDKNVAMQASESALKSGEADLAGRGGAPIPVAAYCADCVWQLNLLPDLGGQAQTWWQGNGNPVAAAISGVNSAPLYVMEAQSYVPDNLDMGQNAKTGTNVYRVTAYGTGATDDAKVILQSTYAKRFN